MMELLCGCASAANEESRKNVTVQMIGLSSAGYVPLDKQIWDYLVDQYENEYAAAAMMGNSDFETALCPYRVESDKEIDENGRYPFSLAYTEQVDSGEVDREEFAYTGPNGGAYGIFAWTSAGRKEGLYDFAKQRNVSIADWQMQLDYAYQEIVERYYELYCVLLTAQSVYEATRSFGMIFEQAENIIYTTDRRAEIAQEYFDKFSDGHFKVKYEKGTLLPINHSYNYMDMTIEQDVINKNIYAYMAQYVLYSKEYLASEPCGYYGDEMARAIVELQKDYGAEPTGELTPETWKLLK